MRAGLRKLLWATIGLLFAVLVAGVIETVAFSAMRKELMELRREQTERNYLLRQLVQLEHVRTRKECESAESDQE